MLRSGWNRALGVALVTVAWAGRAQAGTCTLPSWNSPGPGSPMGAAVHGHAVTSCGGFVYSASGASGAPPGGGDVTLFQRYNPASNAWETLANVPIPVVGASLACDSAGGRLFLFGGANSATGIGNLVQVYTISPPPGSWSTGPSMPGPRAGMAYGVIGSSVYLVGGLSTITTVESQNWRFDFGPMTYDTTLASLPFPRARSGAAVSGGLLFVISGEETPGGQVNTNYAYNPTTNTWATKAPLPLPAVNAPGATALGAMNNCHGDIIVVGGGTPFLAEGADGDGTTRAPGSTALSRLYNVASDAWSNGPTLPTARFALRAAQAGDALIAFGGWDGAANVTTVDRIQGPPLPVQLQSFRVE